MDLNDLVARIDQHNATYRELAARKDAILARVRAGDEAALDGLRAMDGEMASVIRTELDLQAECQRLIGAVDQAYSRLGEAEEVEGWEDEVQELLADLRQEDDGEFDEFDDEKALAATIAALERAA